MSKEIERRMEIERRIVRALIRAAHARGYVVSYHDGEEWAVRRGKESDIMKEVHSTDEAMLAAEIPAEGKIARFQLVYGNDGYDVIADHSDNASANLLMADIQHVIDKAEMAA